MKAGPRRCAALLALGSALLCVGAARAGEAPSNDPGSALQWGLAAIGAPAAWRTATGKGITIAVVDSGIALGHEDLQGGKIVGHVSCLDSAGNEAACADGGQDDDGHGSHVAGIAAATTGNGVGVAGVAPDASLLAVKVLRHSCDALNQCTASGSGDDVSAGIIYAADHGADVINLSLGSTTQAVLGVSFSKALEYAWSKGAIPVVAAGNDFILPSGFSNQHAVVVGALNRDGGRASYSNGTGQAMWAISAPGGEADSESSCKDDPQGVLSTYWTAGNATDAYACLAGTSMAAPHVSGALAVLRSSGLTAAQAVERLLGTANAGALDLAAAVGSPPTTTTAPPTPDPVPDPATSAPSTTGAPGASQPPPSSDAGQPTSAPPVVVLPGPPANRRSSVAVGQRGATNGGALPAGPVTAAALMAVGVGSASGWMLIRGAGWARRTPG